jgi:hypothetical protein
MISFERSPVELPAFAPFESLTMCLDADVSPAGHVVLVTRNVHGISIHFRYRGTTQQLAYTVCDPNVRWIAASQALLFDGSSDEMRDNAWVIDDDGTTRCSFRIGDAIADVLANRTCIVATYYDEGVFGDDPFSQNGIAAFTRTGEFLWGWGSIARSERSPIYDCYAACFADDDATLGAFLYGGFNGEPSYAFGTVDLEARAAVLHAVPVRLHRTKALSSARDGTWLFAVGPGNEQHVVAWRPGDVGYAQAPSPIRLTRGLGGGRFLSITDDSVEVVTVTVHPEA